MFYGNRINRTVTKETIASKSTPIAAKKATIINRKSSNLFMTKVLIKNDI